MQKIIPLTTKILNRIKSQIGIPLLLIVPFILSSCASVYYSSHINSSFIEEKGETNIGAALSLTSLNAQFSTAPSDKLRLAASISSWGWNVSIGDFESGSSGIQGQMLAGYHTKIGDHTFFEGYGGIGASGSNDDVFGHLILQPSFGFGNEHPNFVLSLRINYLNNSVFGNPNLRSDLAPGETNTISGMYYDFALTHRFIRENRTWFLQYGMSGGDIQERLGDSGFIPFLNFGVNARLFSKAYRN